MNYQKLKRKVRKLSNINSLLPKVILSVSAVGKDHQASGAGMNYKFRSIDDVYNAVNKALGENGICILPKYEVITNEVVEKKSKDQYGKEKTTNQRNVLLSACYIFTAPDGSCVHTGPFFGEATDYSDKAFNKAMSQAYKYCLFQTLIIPTEEQKDTEFGNHAIEQKTKNENKPKLISDEQIKRLYSVAKGNENTAKTILNKYGYKSSKEVTINDYKAICEEIEATIKTEVKTNE